MTSLRTALASLVIAATGLTAAAASAQELPPNHPAIDGSGAAPTNGQALPPNHPAIGAGSSGASLPANHPPITGASSGAPADAQALPSNHPPIGGSAAMQPGADTSGLKNSEELIKQLDKTEGLKGRDKPFQVAASLGKLYYGNGRFQDAVAFLKEAVDKGEPVRALYLSELKKARAKKLDLPNAQTAGCVFADTDSLEHMQEVATAKSKSGETAAAATCARVAVAHVMEARQLYAGALINTGDLDGAVKVLEQNVETTPDDADVLWTHALAVYESKPDDVKALAQVKSELQRYLTLRPEGDRTDEAKKLVAQFDQGVAAGGMSKLDAKKYQDAHAKAEADAKAAPKMAQNGGMPAISPEAMQAIQNTEKTPELMAGLQKLVDEAEDHLANGRFQDALDNYKRVVPFEPENGRAKAGMAWAMVGLNRQPMADRVWQVAVQADPKAVDDLGGTLKGKGDAKGAAALWKKLAETDPSYAASAGLAKRIEQ